MATPTVGVLALQGDVREHLRAFAAVGARALPVRFPGELDAVDALVIPGGESTTISRLLRVFGLEDPLRRRLAAGMPSLGTCAGMILLARTVLDGRPDQLTLAAIDVDVRRNGYGRQVDSFETDLDMPLAGETPVRGVFIRAPVVERVGAAVEVLAEHGGRPVAVRQGSSLGLSFHPEMTRDLRLHRLFVAGIAPTVVAGP